MTFTHDEDRMARLKMPEAIFCEGKDDASLAAILVRELCSQLDEPDPVHPAAPRSDLKRSIQRFPASWILTPRRKPVSFMGTCQSGPAVSRL